MKGRNSQVIQALISRALNHPDRDLEVWGSGRQGRDFIYVSDITHWLVNLWLPDTQRFYDKPLQRGSGVNTPIREVAQHIHRLTGLERDIRYMPVSDEGERGRKSDNSTFNMLYSHLPPALPIQEGLRRYINWAIAHESWWRETIRYAPQPSPAILAAAI